ncbi:MAG: four-carbon acid sugar kinase family protein [Acidobacteria bacterium]|nr:four-carbon acid sugar kinase family protein [Acidobacteriota bacterium]
MNGRLLFGAVADDDTGASDLAGMLAEQRLRTLLVIDLPAQNQFEEWSAGHHAVVLAEGTRNLRADEARARTRAAIQLLKSRDPRAFQLKYCSTFDSTPEGNIGPTIDAALEELGEEFTVALPALPVNGRTTYKGYHFVHERLLSDSPMREHPLTPMTEPNLVRHLSRQTARRVGLAPFESVEAGPEELRRRFERLRADGVSIAVVDCLSDAHVETVCRASADLRLVTGGSAFGQGLPKVWRERGWVEEFDAQTAPLSSTDAGGRGRLVVAGSCSVATRAQNRRFVLSGAPAFRVEPRALLSEDFKRASLVETLRRQLASGRDCLLYTTDEPAEVARVQSWAAGEGLDVQALGQRLAYALADLVAEILVGVEVGGLVFAGGETSGALCRRLNLGALRVGRNVEPGVPLCYSLGRYRLPVVLKSGNFGGEDFYGRALEAAARPAEYIF